MRTEIGAERWRRIEDILDAALARAPADWDAVLDHWCEDDAALRAEVESLLRQSEKAASFLAEPPAAVAAAAIQEAGERRPAGRVEGRRIGAYRLVREIGRGGMARVFLSERVDGGFAHRVALKLLRPGLDTDMDHARFRAERQILASLNHANIARLLDGGATEDGLPYFVLEYVDGKPIDVHLDERNASVEERVLLFLTVCDATQYAHRNLVVHRDLKPSNILVDSDGTVKLLDFGLAKYPLLPGASGPVSRATRRWMTPEYAAPEQIRGGPSTTLTDVYQLGAVLYELLTREPPFAGYCVTLPAFERAILNDQPEAPSAVAARKGGGMADRAKALHGDLDAIVLKALRKEPEERYDSVDALERDLRAFLSGDAVQARRTTASYRARRFVRRHRVETVATISVVLAALSGLVISISLARRAAAERDRAATASHESDAISSFLINLFDATDPAETGGGRITASELVHRAAERANALRAQPLAQARMLEVTARLYHSLGEYRYEMETLERALEIRRRTDRASSLEMARVHQQMGRALIGAGRFSAADSAIRRALALQEAVLGPRDRAVAATLLQLAGGEVFLGDLRAAEHASRRALSISEGAGGPNDSATAHAHLTLGSIQQRQGHFNEAEAEYRRAWDGYEKSLGPGDPEVAQSIMHVGYVLQDDPRRIDEADSLFRRALEIRGRAFGETHPLVAATLNDIAGLLLSRGDTGRALPLARQSFAITQNAYGPDHPLAVSSIGQMANIYARAGRPDLAEPMMRSAVPKMRRIRGNDHASVASTETDLARIMIDRGEYDGAEAFVEDALRIQRVAFGPDHPITARTEAVLGRLRMRTGALAEADSLLHRSLGIVERHSGREHSDAREIFRWLAELETARGRPAEAARYRTFAGAR